jgi:mono/diheme cytochrome c family protein
MHKLFRTMMLGSLCIPLFLAAQSGSNVVLPQDKGPDKVDVSGYPAETQKGYKLFTGKCSKCHTIARPINTLMTRDEWSRYVKRMMHKPNSGISDAQGKEIFDFLAYDQANRKDKDPKSFFKALSDEEIEKLKAQH